MTKYSLNRDKKQNIFYGIAILVILLIRIILNAFVPLMDKTEARYAEIARIMVETNNWITPQIDYGVHFWAKPPLSTWLSAISMKIFGINEFAVRFPYLLLSIVLILIVGKYAKQSKLPFYLSGFILLTLPEFLIHAGVVSTDTVLAFCIAITMLAFWESVNSARKSFWNYLFFIGLGLGLLAKGPIVGILVIPPIFIWTIIFKEWRKVFKVFPWVLGILITLLIAVPWYMLAEKNSPGFLDYFIVGEHFKRFFDSGWIGDKYGTPKTQVLGIIWLFLFVFALPWIQVVIYRLWKNRLEILKNRWVVFLVLWLVWTPVFFTVSKSLLHTYILPVMVPIALLITYFWKSIRKKTALITVSLIIPSLAIIIFMAGVFNPKLEYYINSDKYLINNHVKNKDIKLYYLGEKDYSSQFYSKGAITSISNLELSEKINQESSFMILIFKKHVHKLSEVERNKLDLVDSNSRTDLYKFELNKQ